MRCYDKVCSPLSIAIYVYTHINGIQSKPWHNEYNEPVPNWLQINLNHQAGAQEY